jgi:WD40 repeat protein
MNKASISDEKLVFLWDIRTKKPFNIILAHSDQILDLDISADGR